MWVLKVIVTWPIISEKMIEQKKTFSNLRFGAFLSLQRIISATINDTVLWKIFVVAYVGIFEKEYQSAYWIVGARITLWLDSKSGSRDVYCYRNDIEGTTCLHRPSINPLAIASNFPSAELRVYRNSKPLLRLASSRKCLAFPFRLFN